MIYITLFLLSFTLTYYIKKISIKNSLLDVPNERSSHVDATAHGGGIAIAVAWFVGISYLFFLNEIEGSFYFALSAGFIISAVSYLDDLYGLNAKIRLAVQILSAVLGLYFLGGFEKVDLLFMSIENQVFTNIFGALMIVWFINVYNFIDGIDGYAASEAVFLALGGFLLFGGAHFLVLIAAVLGFLVWNWHKAKIFMGDVGSTLLGYNIAIFTIYYANEQSANLWVWVILFGLFWFDATVTLFRRYKNSQKLTQAHRKHAYQRLVQSGWRHDSVVVASMIVNIVLFGIVYIIGNVFAALALSLVILSFVMKYADSKKRFE